MGRRGANKRNFWSDIMFIDQVREIKRARSCQDKKDYSDADVTLMIVQHPIFQELKKKLLENEANFTSQIKIQMDRRRFKL